MSAVERWRDDLASWAIPEHILARAVESPWGTSRPVFVRRAERRVTAPEGPTYRLARESLDPPGSVLDVGAGAGAASLPLAGALTRATAVDTDPDLLAAYRDRAGRLGVPVAVVAGRWPEVAGQVPPADVVVCGHVLYNVPDLAPFVAELTAHAYRRVVVELTERHPMTPLNPLWQRFHGITRPERPTADGAVDALRELGLRPEVIRWRSAAEPDYATLDELAEVTRRRLCLPAGETGAVRAALREAGTVAAASGGARDLVTLCWPGTAAPG